MKKFKDVSFDSFDNGASFSLDAYNADTENTILQRLSKDFGIGLPNLSNILATYFPKWYNPNISLSENANMIYENLSEKEKAGEPLTAVEKILLNSIKKAKTEIEGVRKEQVKLAIFENIPILLISVFAIVFLTRKLSK